MDAIFASSRGRTLVEPIVDWHPDCTKLMIWTIPSAKLEELQYEAYDFLNTTSDPTNCHIYFVAGLCDITVHERRGRYKEVYYIESIQNTIDRLKNLIDTINHGILILGAKPCFSTIIPSSLQDWNFTRLQQHKTTHLLHSHQYNDMQHLLNRAVIEINQHINTTNIDNKMQTPQLADTIITKRRTSPPRFHYNRLADGVHPTKELSTVWANCLKKIISNNRHPSVPQWDHWENVA